MRTGGACWGNVCHADVRQTFFEEMIYLARSIAAAFTPRKLNYELLGNQTPHLHWHLFPRYSDDPGLLEPVWLAIETARHDPSRRQSLEGTREQRNEIVCRLRKCLEKTWGQQ